MCGCPLCRADHNRVQKRDNRRRAERLIADPTLARHGTWSTYSNWCCRCVECCEAAEIRNASYRSQNRSLVDPFRESDA